MQVVESIEKLRRILAEKRRHGATVAFVPTMGNLHEGHLALVREAGRRADCVAASVFVNPTQFGPGEDYEAYPRTEVEDRKKLGRAGADLLFLPGVDEIYPQGSCTTVEVRGLSDIHCGKTRPGHFRGVTTVVCKLFNMVQPDVAIFGEKDFQQL
ncbi:MAG: 4-phosphopantoate--beta-alanine ligase, partial [Gammaproteobacteria bacterium]